MIKGAEIYRDSDFIVYENGSVEILSFQTLTVLVSRLVNLYNEKSHECSSLHNLINFKEERINELRKEKEFTFDETIIQRDNYIEELKDDKDRLNAVIDALLHKSEIQDKILWKIDDKQLHESKDVYIYKLEQLLLEIKNTLQSKNDWCDYHKDCSTCEYSCPLADMVKKIKDLDIKGAENEDINN